MNERNKRIVRLIADGLISESFGALLAKDEADPIAYIRVAASATKNGI